MLSWLIMRRNDRGLVYVERTERRVNCGNGRLCAEDTAGFIPPRGLDFHFGIGENVAYQWMWNKVLTVSSLMRNHSKIYPRQRIWCCKSQYSFKCLHRRYTHLKGTYNFQRMRLVLRTFLGQMNWETVDALRRRFQMTNFSIFSRPCPHFHSIVLHAHV